MVNEKAGFILTVVLILGAAILAGNMATKQTARTPALTGQAVSLGDGCMWITAPSGGVGDAMTAYCTASRPNVAAGGCKLGSRAVSVWESAPINTNNATTDGWQCRATAGTATINAFALCCQ